MSDKSFFSGTDAELYTGSNHFSSLLTSNYADYGVTQVQAQNYATLNGTYGTCYLAAINPDTRNKAKTAAKNDAKKALKIAASRLAKIIDAQPDVTDQMKIELGLAVGGGYNPLPAPTDSPAVDILEVVGRVVRVKAHEDKPDPKRGLPKNVKSVAFFAYVGANAPTDPTEYLFMGVSTRAITELAFPDSVPSGSTVWLCANWIGTRGQIGIGSAPVNFTVQGGNIRARAA